MKKVKLACCLFVFTCLLFSSYRMYAQTPPPDENYDDDPTFSVTSNDFTNDDVRYQITGTSGTYHHETSNLTFNLSEGGSGDYALIFDQSGAGGISQITISSGNSNSFQLVSMSFDILSDTDVQFTTDNGGSVTLTPNDGLFVYYQNYDFTAHSGFENITSFTISGTNLTTDVDDLNFNAPQTSAPTVTTTAETGVGATSATLGGNVIDDGGATVSERGIVWATTTAPDINDNKVTIGSGTGSFSQAVGLLPFGTTIYVRAYATNSEGTAYGTEESFTTSGTVSVSLTGSEGWRLLSVPDDVALSTFLAPIWTQGATSGGDTDFGTPNVYTWSTSIDGNNQADWQSVTDLTNTTLAGGHGFLVQAYSDDNYDGTPDGFTKTLSVTGSEYSSGVSPTMNSNATGWTLLGNPFASPIVYNQISPTNLSGTIYTWDPNDNNGDGGTEPDQTTGSWKTWNGSNGDLTGGRIAPFQGFLVENATTGSSVSFTQASKTSTATTFLGKEKQNNTPFVRLELQGKGMSNSAWLEFSSDGSTENTEGDAWELTPLSTNYALLATRKADGSLVDIGRYPQASKLEIPLITEATQSGTYTLHVTDFEATGQSLYLNDLQRGESIRLEKDTRYEFRIDQAAKAPANPFALLQGGLKKETSNTHRFVISSSALENPVETPKKFTLEQNYPNPFNPVTVINYQLPVNSEVRLEVFDMAGRQIATLVNSQQNAGVHSVNFDGSNLSSGVYMYRLQAAGNVFTKKLTLIK